MATQAPAESEHRGGRGSPAVRLTGIRRTYGEVVAIEGLDLEIAEGEFFTLLGPSGSGKTTTLRVIAGFERPDTGRVELAGVDVTRRRTVAARPQHRLPGLRPVPAHDGARERRVRAAREGRRPPRAAQPGERGARARASPPGRRAPAGAALGRPAPARRARARDREPPDRAAARRAARRARPEAAPGDAGVPQGPAAGSRHHVRLRHARPGRGADDERPPGGLQRGAHRADREPRGGVRASGDRVRCRLRRNLERARARRTALHDPSGEDPHDRGNRRRRRDRRDPRGRLRRQRHALHRRPARRRRARRRAAEPRDVVAPGTRSQRQACPARVAAGAHL